MSEVAGRMAVQAAAHHLESPAGGAGILLGGVPGTPAAKVLIIGGGVSGTEAAKIALGMRAIVRVLDTNPSRLAYLSDIFGGRLDLVVPNRARTAAYVAEADVVIGAVLVPGAKAPKLVTREMIAAMRPGSVVVDIAIDQGGCFETSRPTTHSDPTYVEEGVIHYCVANIPGAVARTSTLALTSATLPYLVRVAEHGVVGAAAGRPGPAARPEHARREARQPAGRRGARAGLHRPRGAARLIGPRAGGLAHEVVALGDVGGPAGGLGVRRAGRDRVAVELVQVAAHGVPAVAVAEHPAQPVGLAQPRGGAEHVPDGDRPAQHRGRVLPHRVGGERDQVVVPGQDLRPVGLRRGRRVVVEGGDGGLDLVAPRPLLGQRRLEDAHALGDLARVPAAPVLPVEGDDPAVGVGAGPGAGRG